MKKVAFYTLGCKVNQYETEAMLEMFEKEGYEQVSNEDYADVYVINTCTVTHMSDRKSRQYVRRMRKKNPDAIIAVVGCYSQVSPEEILEIEEVNLVMGTNERRTIVNEIKKLEALEGEKKATKIIKIRKGEDLYEITHYYGRSSSGNKSYIKKNGEELNDTGSIRSFLTILEGELNISKDYFVLGRLGDNVSNFIDQSMTDRKKYINKFIPNIDRFLDAFKLSSDRLNSLDRQIKTINVSLERYGDIEENEAHRAKLQTRLRKLEEVKTKLSSDLAVLKSKESNILEKLAD